MDWAQHHQAAGQQPFRVEALMLPIAAASPSADLVYKQSQLALKAPKVGFPLLEATGHVRACLQPY